VSTCLSHRLSLDAGTPVHNIIKACRKKVLTRFEMYWRKELMKILKVNSKLEL
jgi:hypothetical protein